MGALALTLVIGVTGVACDDLPLCQSEVFVAFEQTVIADVDASAPGIQTQVRIRTSLQEGDEVVLEVFAADGTSLGSRSIAVDADGGAVFTGVSVTPPHVVLRATGRGTCGEGHDEITVEVSPGATCTVHFVPEPETSAHFAPLRVLSTRSDPDPVSPGYQTTVIVATRPGWNTEIFRATMSDTTSDTSDEESLGTVVADGDGIAGVPVTVLDGWVGFRAICRGAGAELASPTTTLIADTTPPSCELVAPIPGATITPELDANSDLSDGIQLEAVGHADGSDVAGEAVILEIHPTGGAPLEVPASDADDTGRTVASATLAPASTPATYSFELTMRDHAGNRCMALASYDVVYDGCAIAVALPAGPVTRDADATAANGSQADITLAVTPSCAGRPVTGTCGAGSFSGTVGPGGQVTLRADLCAISPCETVVDCAFEVTAVSGATTRATATIVFDDLRPPAVADLTATAVDRQHIRLRWTAPADGARSAAGYVLKSSPVPLTDASFDSTGTALAISAPRTAGSPESFDVVPARTGAAHYFGIAVRDGAGNRSVVAVAGPVVPAFDQTGAILPGNAGQGALGLGSAIAHGKFNNDEFEDLAVAAPFQSLGGRGGVGAVYVYFGGPGGIAATPGLAITSAETGANLGAGLAAVRWSSASRDDLVIGAPGADGGDGRIFVVRGGAGFGTGTRPATGADLTIRVSAARPGWFAGGELGSALVAADVDGDGTADLVASAPRGGGKGGAVILYGGTVTGNAVLSDDDPAAANGAIIERFADPGSATGRRLGFYLHAVGKTLGASDTTDDLVIAYADNYASAGDSLFVLRGNGSRPAGAGVTVRPFAPGRDVRLDLVTGSRVTEWGSSVTSIDDQNGDGARDLVIGAYRSQNDRGQVLIVSGNLLGLATGGIVRTTDSGATLTTITPAATVSRLGVAIASHAASRADIDGDGREDLFIAGLSGVSGVGFVWFGGAIPRGTITTATAPYRISAPRLFTFQRQRPQGFGGQAQWIGDVNHDGLDDLCWASPFDNNRDGGFEVLWDAR